MSRIELEIADDPQTAVLSDSSKNMLDRAVYLIEGIDYELGSSIVKHVAFYSGSDAREMGPEYAEGASESLTVNMNSEIATMFSYYYHQGCKEQAKIQEELAEVIEERK